MRKHREIIAPGDVPVFGCIDFLMLAGHYLPVQLQTAFATVDAKTTTTTSTKKEKAKKNGLFGGKRRDPPAYDVVYREEEEKGLKEFLGNDKRFRMYGTPKEFIEQMKIFANFPGAHKCFVNSGTSCYYTTPLIHYSLKNEKFVCKTDLFVLLQTLMLYTNPESREIITRSMLSVFLKSQEDRLNGSIEFVKVINSGHGRLGEEIKDMKTTYVDGEKRLQSTLFSREILEKLKADFYKYTVPEIVEKYKKLIPTIQWREAESKLIHNIIEDASKQVGKEKFVLAMVCSYTNTCTAIKTFQNVIKKHEEWFTKRAETKPDENCPITVRLFEDNNRSFVIKSELLRALNITKSNSKKSIKKSTKCDKLMTCCGLESIDAIELEDIRRKYPDKLDSIEFIRFPIVRTKHRAVPIKGAESEEFFVFAVDALLELLRSLVCGARIFQSFDGKYKKDLYALFADLGYIFRAEFQQPNFIQFNRLQEIIRSCSLRCKYNHKAPIKDIREVRPTGFTVDDLRDELKYVELMEAFPEILGHVEVVYEAVVKAKKEEHLRTCDMFDAVEYCQMICVFEKFPKLHLFLHNQKACHRVPGLHCDTCPPIGCSPSTPPATEPFIKMHDKTVFYEQTPDGRCIIKGEVEEDESEGKKKKLSSAVAFTVGGGAKKDTVAVKKKEDVKAPSDFYIDLDKERIVARVAGIEKQEMEEVENTPTTPGPTCKNCIEKAKMEVTEKLVVLESQLKEWSKEFVEARKAGGTVGSKSLDDYKEKLTEKIVEVTGQIEELEKIVLMDEFGDKKKKKKKKGKGGTVVTEKLMRRLLEVTAHIQRLERFVVEEDAEKKKKKMEEEEEKKIQEKKKTTGKPALLPTPPESSRLTTTTTKTPPQDVKTSLTTKEKARVINGKFGLPPGMIRKADIRKIQAIAIENCKNQAFFDREQHISIVVAEGSRIKPNIACQTDADNNLTIKVGIPEVKTAEKSAQTEEDYGRNMEKETQKLASPDVKTEEKSAQTEETDYGRNVEKETQEVMKLKKKLTGFEKKMTEVKAENERNVEKWKKDFRRKQDEVDELKRKISADDVVARNNNQRLTRELKDKNKEINEVRQELSTQTAASKKSTRRIEKLELELRNQQEENEKLRKSITNTARLTAENQEMKQRMEQIEQNEIRLKEAYSRIRSSFDDSRVKFSERISEMGHALRCEKQKSAMSEERVVQLKSQLEQMGSGGESNNNNNNNHEKLLLQHEIERKNYLIRKLEESNSLLARQNTESTEMVRDLLKKLKSRIPMIAQPRPIGSERHRNVVDEKAPVSPVPVELLQLPRLPEPPTTSAAAGGDWDDDVTTTVIQATVTKQCTVTRSSKATVTRSSNNNNTWQQQQKDHHHSRDTVSGELVDSQCVICLVEMNAESGEELIKCHECRRRFHGDCASEWLKVKSLCPVCKGSLLDPHEFPAL